MRNIQTSAIAFLAAALASVPALAASKGDSGFEIGLRTGYAFSAGNVGAPPNGTDSHLSDWVSGQWPFWLDAGYRFNPSFYLGGYFQYGVGFVNDDQQSECRNANVDCSASDIRAGIMGRYHLPFGSEISPWVGYGIGWEWTNFSEHGTAFNVRSDVDHSLSGFEFANLQAGVDFQLPRRVVLAPFISFSMGQFDSWTVKTRVGSTTTEYGQGPAKESVHEWFLIGLRAAVMP